jgi:predicted Kef-type K+ transport protein
MDFEWIAIALGDVVWIALAFAMGLLSRAVGLPPLVGFLAAGFLLNVQGIAGGETLGKLSDLGITLLLFIVGLKLNLATLGRPQVWAVAGIHMCVVVALFGFAIYGLALLGASFVNGLDFGQSMLIAFALSFSSTVFAVKTLEERGEMASLHGRIAIGILIMQDLAAVVFLAISVGKVPSFWALSIVLLLPLRPVLHIILKRIGHGELLVLYGFLLALGGAEIFELVGLKGDLGAIVAGVMMSSHIKADELSKNMLGFKDLCLLGFFLSIGLSGPPSFETLMVASLLTPFIFLKSALFFGLLAAFKLRAHTTFFASLNLTNFSEFGLIVAAIGVSNGWLGIEWLIVLAIAMSLSFAVAACLNTLNLVIYSARRAFWTRLQRVERLPDDRPFDIQGAKVAIIGMGGIGTGTYDRMREVHGETVVGVDIDPRTVGNQRATGRNVLAGDPGDADFWDRMQATHTIELVMLALPNLNTNLAVLVQLKAADFTGKVAAMAKFQDEADALTKAGATTVFNVYTEAGAGFAAHVLDS